MTSAMHARRAKLKTHLASAKARIKQHVTPRRVVLLLAAACSASLLLATVRALHSRAPGGREGAAVTAASTPGALTVHDLAVPKQQLNNSECARKVVPATVAAALVHYATSSETPRQITQAEAAAAARVVGRRAPCNLLVFGLGADAVLWAALNHGGRTLFLEADAGRVASFCAARPAGLDLHAHPVMYQQQADHATGDDLLALRDSPDCASPTTKPLSPDDLERSACPLAPRGLPAAFYESEWDVIVVTAPAPGALYGAGVVGRARSPGAGETEVVVHGVDAPAEERLTRAFLCDAYLVKEEEAGSRTRRFAVPSHRDKEAMPFCP